MYSSTLWQEPHNAIWYSNKRLICDHCGKKPDRLIELSDKNMNTKHVFCFLSSSNCFIENISYTFALNKNDEYLLARQIIIKEPKTLKKKKREPIGLSLRFDVMKNDGFQCVLCGDSGKIARLEIDHIIPVADGGKSIESNLQTLCFKCNRGKMSKRL